MIEAVKLDIAAVITAISLVITAAATFIVVNLDGYKIDALYS